MPGAVAEVHGVELEVAADILPVIGNDAVKAAHGVCAAEQTLMREVPSLSSAVRF